MRIRTIKPEFWQDEQLSELDAESTLLAIGLLNYADDHGYFNAHPGLVQAGIFPLRKLSRDIRESLARLEDIDWIRIVNRDGKRWGVVVGFEKHQKVDKPGKSRICGISAFPEDFAEPSREFREYLASVSEKKSAVSRSRDLGAGNRDLGAGEAPPKAPPAAPADGQGPTPEEIEQVKHSDIAAAWNSLPAPFPKIKGPLNDERRAKLRTRLESAFWRDNWREALRKLPFAAFCTGQNARRWVADFDWFIQNGNSVQRILEGKYDNAPKPATEIVAGNGRTVFPTSGLDQAPLKPAEEVDVDALWTP